MGMFKYNVECCNTENEIVNLSRRGLKDAQDAATKFCDKIGNKARIMHLSTTRVHSRYWRDDAGLHVQEEMSDRPLSDKNASKISFMRLNKFDSKKDGELFISNKHEIEVFNPFGQVIKIPDVVFFYNILTIKNEYHISCGCMAESQLLRKKLKTVYHNALMETEAEWKHTPEDYRLFHLYNEGICAYFFHGKGDDRRIMERKAKSIISLSLTQLETYLKQKQFTELDGFATIRGEGI